MQDTYLDKDTDLAEFCSKLKDAKWLALDTEFIREKTYYPELSLIQIASESYIACIDPYKINNFKPLTDLFEDANIVKIFHSPSQDLELFAHQFKSVPQNIFDTQLAASLLGIGNQIGYADLVNKLCKVQLDKKHTRTDWSKRPLSESELDYALDDVRYLGDIYHTLTEKLISTDRINWLAQDFKNLSDINQYQTDWSSLWKKLKGSQKLKGNELHYADQICQWREKIGQQKNLPKRWVLKDEDVIDIARLKPTKLTDFKAIRTLKDHFIQKNGNTLINIIIEADKIDDALKPKHEKFKSLSDNQQIKADCLMAICRRCSAQNDMALASLATKKDIDKLVLGKETKLLSGWRYEMAGEACQKFLNGELKISVNNEGIVTIS